MPARCSCCPVHVQQLQPYADRMDDMLKRGDLGLARMGAALLSKRRETVAAAVASLLAKPFDYNVEETLETDSDKRAYAQTEAQLANRWRKILKLQVLERIWQMEAQLEARKTLKKDPEDKKKLEEIPTTLPEQEAKARKELADRFEARFTRLQSEEPLEPVSRFLNAITNVFDPHTSYLAPADKENFDIDMTGSLEGIGAVLAEKDHLIVVREVVPGGASHRQGQLEAGDLILSVAQAGARPVDVTDMPINKVVRMIRGPKGTFVTLTVKKSDSSLKVIRIRRDVVQIEAAYARGAMVDLGANHDPMGYIYLPSFYGGGGGPGKKERNATGDVKALLSGFQKQKVPGVVFDLRGNGGGLLGHARDITGLLIETGPVVQTRYPGGKTEVLKDKDPSVSYSGEVIVLVDRASASASEILAGALQDYGRALVVGTGPTHGKGTVQALINLDQLKRVPGGPPLGVVKLTIQQYFRVDGDSTQSRGVVPDVLLPDPIAHIEAGERHLDHAIPWSEIAPLPHRAWKSGGWSSKDLATKSKKRRQGHEIFAKVNARGSYLKAQRDDTLVPLKREAWLARRNKSEKALKTVDPKIGEGNPRLEVALIDYAGKGQKPSATVEEWRKDLTHDPWLEETLHVLADMTGTPTVAKNDAK